MKSELDLLKSFGDHNVMTGNEVQLAARSKTKDSKPRG